MRDRLGRCRSYVTWRRPRRPRWSPTRRTGRWHDPPLRSHRDHPTLSGLGQPFVGGQTRTTTGRPSVVRRTPRRPGRLLSDGSRVTDQLSPSCSGVMHAGGPRESKGDEPHTHTTRHCGLVSRFNSFHWPGRSGETAKQASLTAPCRARTAGATVRRRSTSDRGQDHVVRGLNALCLSPRSVYSRFGCSSRSRARGRH